MVKITDLPPPRTPRDATPEGLQDYMKYCARVMAGEEEIVEGYNPIANALYNPPTEIKAGIVAMVHSLQSAAGKELNGSRVLPLRQHENGRWECRVEYEEEYNATKALKADNLKVIPRLCLPYGPDRGMCDVDRHDGSEIMQKLCELLVYSNDDYKPSEIMFCGYASMAFQRMGHENFDHFYCSQMEQMGAALGIGNLCREAEEPATEAAVFALLEGDQMYVDTMMQTMYCISQICEFGSELQPGFPQFSEPDIRQLTPDQGSAPYLRTMLEGPVLLLSCVSKYNFAPALWGAMANSEFYHLLIQRLLRWVAREAKGTLDGKSLGRNIRKILSSMFPEIAQLLTQPISEDAADKILSESATVLSDSTSVTIDNLKRILD